MSYRLTKLTTRTGDDGKTNVGTKTRLAKHDPRIAALGDLDELNSALGLILAYQPTDSEIASRLLQTQQELFDLGSELCPPYRATITLEKIAALETFIEKWNAALPPLREFILPGGNIKSAHCHLARTICRRAERSLVLLHEKDGLNLDILRYINRLSDLLFVIARVLGRETTQEEILWEHEKKKS